MCTSVIFQLILILELCCVITCWELMFGECPLYYDESCRTDLVKFILTTGNSNATDFYYLNPFKPRLPENFNIFKPLKIVIHGYGGMDLDKTIRSVRAAYQTVGHNVILVDWGPLSAVPCYTTAYLNTWHVGQCLAILAVSLIPLGIPPSTLHLIGFSLGAHVAGFSGANLKKALNLRPGRITGLDPALPFFATPNNDWKLDTSDAKFVDVVHTSAGSFGKIEASGHADFYMNGGVLQPVCHNAPHPPLCSHAMSGIYFAESIISEKRFVGVLCDNVANYVLGWCSGNPKATMGEFISFKTRGSFYVDTSNSTPFALGYAFENFVYV